EDQRGIERNRRQVVRGSRPDSAHLAGESLRRRIAVARERVNLAPLALRHLGDDVRRGAEAIDPDAPCITGHPQRAVSDQTGAQQRRSRRVGVVGGDRETIALVRDRPLRISTVDLESGEARSFAQILAAARAKVAGAAGPPEPWDADAVADL